MKNFEMTVHEALSELKMLDRRIDKKIGDAEFAIVAKPTSKFVGSQTIEDFMAEQNANYQSILDLIKRRKAIRNAVSKSNASTEVVIGGKSYTVAEAIEMKREGSEMLKILVEQMTTQLNVAKHNLSAENRRVEEKADSYVTGIFSGRESGSDQIELVRQSFIDSNSAKLVVTKNLEAEIARLSDEIDSFMSQVDSKLSISNAITIVKGEY